MDQTFEEYVRANHKLVAEEYDRYLRRSDLPAIGDIVETLRKGFGGETGVIRKVDEIDEKWITITDGERHFVAGIDTWYKSFKIIE